MGHVPNRDTPPVMLQRRACQALVSKPTRSAVCVLSDVEHLFTRQFRRTRDPLSCFQQRRPSTHCLPLLWLFNGRAPLQFVDWVSGSRYYILAPRQRSKCPGELATIC